MVEDLKELPLVVLLEFKVHLNDSTEWIGREEVPPLPLGSRKHIRPDVCSLGIEPLEDGVSLNGEEAVDPNGRHVPDAKEGYRYFCCDAYYPYHCRTGKAGSC